MKASQLRCWDNGGASFDRYTILPPRKGAHAQAIWRGGRIAAYVVEGIAASEHPHHPQGFGQHVEAQPGNHLGTRVKFETLPSDVQSFARQSFDIKEN